MAIMPGAEPFLLPGSGRGVLLIHGFTGSPAEMRPLGDHLRGQGYTVLCPRLAGHGTTPADMAGTRWPHWYAGAEDGFHLLGGMCDDITAVGLSMGGLLALKLAAEYPLARVVSINAPVFLLDKRLPLLPFYRLFRRYEQRKQRELHPGDREHVAYDRVPLACLASLLDLIKHTDELLPSVTIPSLLIQSRHEHTVRPDSALHLRRRLGGRDRRLVWLERSGHVATLDVEHQQVFKYISDFFAEERRKNQ